MYLPFMSSSSLPSQSGANPNASTATLNQFTSKSRDLKRPQSIQSLALVSNKTAPTVRYIHAMLLHYATPSADQPRLSSYIPHETQLMSALLAPFTTRTAGNRADEERWFGIESFEIAVKTWKAVNNQVRSSFTLVSQKGQITDGCAYWYSSGWRGACGAAKRLQWPLNTFECESLPIYHLYSSRMTILFGLLRQGPSLLLFRVYSPSSRRLPSSRPRAQNVCW